MRARRINVFTVLLIFALLYNVLAADRDDGNQRANVGLVL